MNQELKEVGLGLLEKSFVILGKYLAERGSNPRALLDAELDAADAAAIAEIQAIDAAESSEDP